MAKTKTTPKATKKTATKQSKEMEEIMPDGNDNLSEQAPKVKKMVSKVTKTTAKVEKTAPKATTPKAAKATTPKAAKKAKAEELMSDDEDSLSEQASKVKKAAPKAKKTTPRVTPGGDNSMDEQKDDTMLDSIDELFEDNELTGEETEEDLERRDVELMEEAAKRFNEDMQDWTALCPGDRSLKIKYDSFNEHGKTFFWQLMELLYTRVHKEGIDQFCKLDKEFIWNFSTWLRIILNTAEGVITDPSTQNCLLSSSASIHCGNGHTQLSYRTGRYEFIDTVAHSSRLGQAKFRAKKSLTCLTGRVVCALKNGCPKAEEEASHLCMNVPQTCINPNHLFWESQQVNMGRTGCQTYGCALRCRHTPKCIYTDKEGKWLPCLNSETFSDCRCSDQYCRIADIVKQVEVGVEDLGPKVEKAKANCKCRYKDCPVRDKKIAGTSIRIVAGPQNKRKFWHVKCYSLEDPSFDMQSLTIPDGLKDDFDEALNVQEDDTMPDGTDESTNTSLTDTPLRYATLIEYEQFTSWTRLEPITDNYKRYAWLLSEKSNKTTVVLNQDGSFRLFAKNGESYLVCLYCNQHSGKPNAVVHRVARAKIDLNGISFTQAPHHPDCTPMTEREIVFQEFDRQCRKLVKDGKLDHILAYEKARTFAFHYHYLTTGEKPIMLDSNDEPQAKRARVERDPNWLPNYDLTQKLDGLIGRTTGINAYSNNKPK